MLCCYAYTRVWTSLQNVVFLLYTQTKIDNIFDIGYDNQNHTIVRSPVNWLINSNLTQPKTSYGIHTFLIKDAFLQK